VASVTPSLTEPGRRSLVKVKNKQAKNKKGVLRLGLGRKGEIEDRSPESQLLKRILRLFSHWRAPPADAGKLLAI
jgi:hypothetical protein